MTDCIQTEELRDLFRLYGSVEYHAVNLVPGSLAMGTRQGRACVFFVIHEISTYTVTAWVDRETGCIVEHVAEVDDNLIVFYSLDKYMGFLRCEPDHCDNGMQTSINVDNYPTPLIANYDHN